MANANDGRMKPFQLHPGQALRSVREVLSETLTKFSQERVGTMAAALAYFTFFSIAPMIIVAIAVAGLFFGHEAAQGALSQNMEGLVGKASTPGFL